jgi:sterol desaturase/sphingolipid hydroxylase (fatty acid hydroxylase superfamily)
MHRVHHEKDRHRSNYGIPVWDMLFGTYENSTRSVDCGFSPNQERQVLPMLLFKDVDR